MTRVYVGQPGMHIRDAIDESLHQAQREGKPLTLKFNGTEMLVRPEHSVGDLRAEWERLTGNKVLDAEEEREQIHKGLEEQEAEWDRAIKESGVQDEQELRAMDAPWPDSLDDLTAFIETLVNRPHSYGTCVYATSLAAASAFNYVARRLGITGFQSSCADLDVLRRTRRMGDEPFGIIEAKDLLFPQKNPRFKAINMIQGWKEWAAKEARKKLAEHPDAHPDVIAHWRTLAEHESKE